MRKSMGGTPPIEEVSKPKKIKEQRTIVFQPCSPGQVLEMAKFLGVDSKKEFYLLPVVRRAVVAPFPRDWDVGHDRLGKIYYFNKYTMKVMDVHPLSDVFLEWVEDERKRKQEDDAARALNGEEPDEDGGMGNFWMRFTTDDEDEVFWYNFADRKLFTDPQYNHILAMGLQDKRKQLDGPREDPRKLQTQEQMQARQAMEKYFATGLRRFWLKWTLHMMAERAAQAQALSKLTASGLGRADAKSFKLWQEKAKQLSMVKRAMAPLGGRRDKGLRRDIFNAWKGAVAEQRAAAKEEEELRMTFRAWRDKAVKSLQLKRVKDTIRGMVLGASYSVTFDQWKSVWQASRDQDAKILEAACVRIQSQYRLRLKHRQESKAALNKRKQIRYRLLRVCEHAEASEEAEAEAEAEGHAARSHTPHSRPRTGDVGGGKDGGGGLALLLLEGALASTASDPERARLRQVVRHAKSGRAVQASDPAFDVGALRGDVGRVVDLLDPADTMKLRALVARCQAQRQAAVDAADAAAAGRDPPPPPKQQQEEQQEGGEKKEGGVADPLAALTADVARLLAKLPPPPPGVGGGQGGGGESLAEKLPEEASLLQSTATRAQRMLDVALEPAVRGHGERKAALDDKVTVLEELEQAMELFLTALDKKQAAKDSW